MKKPRHGIIPPDSQDTRPEETEAEKNELQFEVIKKFQKEYVTAPKWKKWLINLKMAWEIRKNMGQRL